MLTTTAESPTHAELRQTAEVRLQGGNAPRTQGWTTGAAALTLLHSLASNPATAGDALKLLHELQVHQVELDLQHEHMEEDRRDLERSAQRSATLYDFAPVAYFTVDGAGRVIEGNLAGARMLEVERDDLGGRSIASLVAPGSRRALLALLEQARGGSGRHSCKAQADGAAGSGWLQVVARASPRGQSCLVVVIDLTDANTPGL
ncbi:MAG: PAS domain-containing protein [Polaromonas sp.]|uniref:PAS domain-containing protein n=1 Tax=Polaromonas sp. TaxID=1869339 RepID=UPI002732950D|nr:PAS domain-containing protein [Polaromonas sp.]MDP2819390.1 PAS domain-containing protein [Polaromonas sp.]